MGDISKLPKWAQRRISTLESNVSYWRDQVESAISGDTNVFMDTAGKRIGLPMDTCIIFIIEGGEIRANVTTRGLSIHGETFRIADMFISPESSNSVKIGFK